MGRLQGPPPGAKFAVIEGPSNEPVPYIVRVKFSADYKVPAHWHPSIERVTVLSGTFNLGTGDKLDKEKTKALAPGSTAIIQPKTNHFAWTSEETVIQLHGVGPRISITWMQRTIRGRSSVAGNPEDPPGTRQRNDHNFGSLIMLAVPAGAFLLVTWIATKGLFFFLQKFPIR